MKKKDEQYSPSPYLSPRWWNRPVGEAHIDLVATVRTIRNAQAYRKLMDMLHASMYGNIQIAGWGYAAWSTRGPLLSERLSMNVVKACVDSCTAEIAAVATPKPTFLTVDGDWEKQQQAKNLERSVEGCFYEGDANESFVRAFSVGANMGTGPVKIYADHEHGRVAYENVLPWEIVTDDGESIYGKPRSMYQRRFVDRRRVMELFAADDQEKQAKIAVCQVDSEDTEFAYNTTADQILVTEGWHLPSKKGAGDGRHVVAVDGCTLVDEPWTRSRFPFEFFRWSDPRVGFWGIGIAEELTGIQTEINKLLRQIQRGMHLITGHYLVHSGSDVTTQHIHNDLAAIVKYSGQPPVYQAPSIISPEIYQHLNGLYARAFELVGVSQLQATGQKPAGLNSGAAQREYQDIQSKRFAEKSKRYDKFVLNCAKQTVECAKELAAAGNYKIRAVSRKSIEYIDWGEINLAETDYAIELLPTSSIPSTVSGKMEWAEDMSRIGQIPPEDMMEILDFPDIERYAKLANADRNVINRNIAHMLKTGEVVTPEPYDNHPLALKLCRQNYHAWRLDGAPQDRLQLLRDYMDATIAYMEPPAEPPPPEGPPMGAPMEPPPGPPMMPPSPDGMMPPEGMPPPPM